MTLKTMPCRTSVVALAALLLPACATQGYEGADLDPYEEWNRDVYAFNKGFDDIIVTPIARGYQAVTPDFAEEGVSNALNNIDEPMNFLNALLQGKVGAAFKALDRAIINTTLGFGGLADRAAEFGIYEQEEDFGQTLAVWGVRSGPYIMLPILGPSTPRDAFGFGVDTVADPFDYGLDEAGAAGWVNPAITGAELIDFRVEAFSTVDPFLETSLDPYAALRSAYIQQRTFLIFDGDVPEEEDEDLPPDPAGVPESRELEPGEDAGLMSSNP